MKLKRREAILGLVVLGLLLALGLQWLLPGSGTSLGGLRTERDRLAAEVDRKQSLVNRGKKASAQLQIWYLRSLPPDEKRARSIYQNWLLELVDRVKLQRARVDSTDGRLLRGVYYLHPFSVHGQGSVEQVLEFLQAFYALDCMHQIRHLSLRPIERSQNMDIAISIEALSLLAAEPRDRLPPASVSADDAQRVQRIKAIAQRRLFQPYTPPVVQKEPEARPVEAPKPPFDATRFVFLTAVLEVDGQPQAWVRSRTTDQTFRLRTGDTFEIGATRATVTRIAQRDIELEINGERHRVVLGASLREATAAAKPGEKPAPQAPASPADKPPSG